MGNGVMRGTPQTDGGLAAHSESMAHTNQSRNLQPNHPFPMDKMKKILSSPVNRKKQHTFGRYFGVHLHTLVERENTKVPRLVVKVCKFISETGITTEGIFRVNGNSRIIDKLKASFDKVGDADLDDAGDVMSVASLLKLFLRELPDTVVPQNMTQKFIQVQEQYVHDNDECLKRLKTCVEELSEVHLNSLRFICAFLVEVAKYEEYNKMTHRALGIVFGPNLFKCKDGISGLREQSVTNQIVMKFMTDFTFFFGPDVSYEGLIEEGNVAGKAEDTQKTKNPPPARPPPPKISPDSTTESMQEAPVPLPRKTRQKTYESSQYQDQEMKDTSDDSSAVHQSSPSQTPRYSDEEFLDTQRSESPFHLDSDRSECPTPWAGTSPMNSMNYSESPMPVRFVEKTISSAIGEHLFGDGVTATMSSDDSILEDHDDSNNPKPAPRKKRKEKKSKDNQLINESPSEDRPGSEDTKNSSVKMRAKQFENIDAKDGVSKVDVKQNRQRPKSSAFEMFENQGLVISAGDPNIVARLIAGKNQPTSQGYENNDVRSASHDSKPVPKPRAKRRIIIGNEDNDMEDDRNPVPISADEEPTLSQVQRQAQTLSQFKRAPGPKNRKSPSRRSRVLQSDTDYTADQEITDQEAIPPTKPKRFLEEVDLDDEDSTEQDVNHNATKPRVNFLDLHQNGSTEERGPDSSPTASHKPYIPPLDLSILHEHGDGSEPILADQGSYAMHKPKPYKEEDVMLSPRMSKLKKKTKYHEKRKHYLYYKYGCDGDVGECPLSPSAFRNVPYASSNYDVDVPPSPPVEQNAFSIKQRNARTTLRDEEYSPQIKQLTKKIQSLKKKIKNFEEVFENEFGYRPSQSDKAARPEIKKCMQELARARKELKRVKEEATTMGLDVMNYDTPKSGGSSSKSYVSNETSRMEDTLDMINHKLGEKRSDADRPEDLMCMTREQVQEEKIAVQKGLLHFESKHGRPSTKSEKELMKPLYDRYRNVKRLLAKPLSPRDKALELESVPEDSTMEFPSPGSKRTDSNRDPVRIPTMSTDDQQNEPQDFGTTDFNVTRDFGIHLPDITRESLRPVDENSQKIIDLSSPDDTGPFKKPMEPNLHELTVPQLLTEQQKVRGDKKRLRKILRDFEDDFQRETGRKVQKEDRAPMETEYHEYKQIKARLKLLEALVSKHDPMGVM